jgi:hypothetical protein
MPCETAWKAGRKMPSAPKALLPGRLNAQRIQVYFAVFASPLSRRAPWNPRQVDAQNEDSERRRHEKRAYPEAPVAMHPSPVRARIGLAIIAAVSFPVVPVSCHLVSISAPYSPRRAA